MQQNYTKYPVARCPVLNKKFLEQEKQDSKNCPHKPAQAGKYWTDWQDLTRFDKIWQVLTRIDKIWQDLARFDKIRQDLTRLRQDLIRNGLACTGKTY